MLVNQPPSRSASRMEYLLTVAAGFLLAASASFAQGPPVQECNAAVRGAWSGPYSLCISCYKDPVPPACSADCDACSGDEIVHLALVPTGPHAGKLLMWTRCDVPDFNPNYKSHLWDPHTGTVTDRNFQIPPPAKEGPYCSGHTWVLDSQLNPRLLVVGGRGATQLSPFQACLDCSGGAVYCGAHLAMWFEPETGTPPILGRWNHDPTDLPDANYYPSVTTYEDTANQRFLPIVVGGGKFAGDGTCGEYDRWWRLEPPYSTSSWIIETDDHAAYTWNQYPRTLLLSSGEILITGHHISDEPPPGTPGYGDQPVRGIKTVLGPQGQDHFLAANPNAQGFPVGGWHYCNAVIMHTLKQSWVWNEINPASQYDLDRVLVTGGSRDRYDDSGVEAWTPAMDYALELVGGPQGTWVQKASPTTRRIFSSWILLPDGAILLAGGQNKQPNLASLDLGYYREPELFHPQAPTSAGAWTKTCPRVIVSPGHPKYPSIIRGYHHVGALLPDGSAVIGGGVMSAATGALEVPPSSNNSSDTFEIYKPSYFFSGPRPGFDLAHSTLKYGEVVCVNVMSPAPAEISRAVLIGIASVTHHFDYGQRYIELMVDPISCGGGNLRVQAPPIPAMAPAGYYLLFLVDNQGLPSVGKFVLVTY